MLDSIQRMSRSAIWQDLVDGHAFCGGGYQSVKRFVRKLRGAVSPEARVIIETRPGEECQVDYGTGASTGFATTQTIRPSSANWRSFSFAKLSASHSRNPAASAQRLLACSATFG